MSLQYVFCWDFPQGRWEFRGVYSSTIFCSDSLQVSQLEISFELQRKKLAKYIDFSNCVLFWNPSVLQRASALWSDLKILFVLLRLIKFGKFILFYLPYFLSVLIPFQRPLLGCPFTNNKGLKIPLEKQKEKCIIQ